VCIRHEIKGGRYFVVRSKLKDWVTKKGRNYKVMLEKLEYKGVIVSKKTKITLGAGTPYSSGQVWTVEIDGLHPAMSGLPRLVLPSQESLEAEVFPPQQSETAAPQSDQTDERVTMFRRPGAED